MPVRTIQATTSGPCGCCAPPPELAVEADYISETIIEPHCMPPPYPPLEWPCYEGGDLSECADVDDPPATTASYADLGTGCECPPLFYCMATCQRTSVCVRGLCTGLIVGHSYTVTFEFKKNGSANGSVDYDFEADADTHETDYFNLTNGDTAVLGNTFTLDSVTIVDNDA